MSRKITTATLLALALTAAPLLTTAPAAAAEGRNAAFAGGLAAGAVGGVLLGQALAPARPVYVQPAPAYPPPAPIPVAVDPYFDQMTRLHLACDQGNRAACVRFGVIIGEHRERQAEWRRLHPDFFAWERY